MALGRYFPTRTSVALMIAVTASPTRIFILSTEASEIVDTIVCPAPISIAIYTFPSVTEVTRPDCVRSTPR